MEDSGCWAAATADVCAGEAALAELARREKMPEPHRALSGVWQRRDRTAVARFPYREDMAGFANVRVAGLPSAIRPSISLAVGWTKFYATVAEVPVEPFGGGDSNF